jgi:hypothetical protein
MVNRSDENGIHASHSVAGLNGDGGKVAGRLPQPRRGAGKDVAAICSCRHRNPPGS